MVILLILDSMSPFVTVEAKPEICLLDEIVSTLQLSPNNRNDVKFVARNSQHAMFTLATDQ
jgi:hypothetical protein